jgi:hypothetical protein
MSDKLTSHELDHYRTFHIWQASAPIHALLAHIAAVEAERDEAAALLREVTETHFWIRDRDDGIEGCYCWLCGTLYPDWHIAMTADHFHNCPIERIRAWLAKQTGDQTERE